MTSEIASVSADGLTLTFDSRHKIFRTFRVGETLTSDTDTVLQRGVAMLTAAGSTSKNPEDGFNGQILTVLKSTGLTFLTVPPIKQHS